MINRFTYIFLIVVSFACSSELELDDSRIGRSYYPIQVGSYWEYEVHEVNYYLVGPEESFYQQREVIRDSIETGPGEYFYTVDIYRRESEEELWSLDSVWTTSVNSIRVVENQNNEGVIKLTFPVVLNQEWDANSYNIMQPDIFKYADNYMDTTLFDSVYVDVIRVIQSDFGEDGLGRDDRYELYAPNVGLIYKNSIVWEYCQQDCSSIKQIVGGRDLEKVLKSYGLED